MSDEDDEFYERNGYRKNAEVDDEEAANVEDGLRDVLTALGPFDEDEVTRILLAVAALYDLPIKEEGKAEEPG